MNLISRHFVNIMCNCKNLPEMLADTLYWERNFDFQGAEEFKRFFDIEMLDIESFTMSLNFDAHLYRCENCGQDWYVESAPEEEQVPEFALKRETPEKVADEIIRSKKQFFSILAHGGFDSKICLKNDCPNFRLNGRSLCHLHISIF